MSTNPNDSKPCAPKGASVRRYSTSAKWDFYQIALVQVTETPVGEWVRFEDHDAIVANLQARLAELKAFVPALWIDGVPPHPFDKEWFIAMTTYGDRVVLKALPEEFSYDFKTADDTYIMKDKIKKWMQFPDSSYIPSNAQQSQELERARRVIEKLREQRNELILIVEKWPHTDARADHYEAELDRIARGEK